MNSIIAHCPVDATYVYQVNRLGCNNMCEGWNVRSGIRGVKIAIRGVKNAGYCCGIVIAVQKYT